MLFTSSDCASYLLTYPLPFIPPSFHTHLASQAPCFAPWHLASQAPCFAGTLLRRHLASQAPCFAGTLLRRHLASQAPCFAGTLLRRHFALQALCFAGTLLHISFMRWEIATSMTINIINVCFVVTM